MNRETVKGTECAHCMEYSIVHNPRDTLFICTKLCRIVDERSCELCWFYEKRKDDERK